MKIPKQAKRVFKGAIFEVYQWPQPMFDGSVETFEMIKRPDTAQIIATVGNKILVARERQPHFKCRIGLLGGRLNGKESPLSAAKRELREEAGLVSKKWTLFKTYEPTIKMDWTVYYFIANDCVRVSKPNLDPGEKIKIIKIDFEELIEKITALPSWNNKFAYDILKIRLKGETELAKLKKKIFGTKNRG